LLCNPINTYISVILIYYIYNSLENKLGALWLPLISSERQYIKHRTVLMVHS